MEIDLDTARDMWAVRYGYDWFVYRAGTGPSSPALSDTFWFGLLCELRRNACLDMDYAAGKMRLKPWK